MGASLTTKTSSRGRRTGGTYRPMAEINVTPFVDVMLVLLIVFMVAAPLLTSGVAVDLPQSEAKSIPDEDNKPIEITLAKDGKLYIGDSEMDEKKLKFQLEAMTEGQADRRIYIRADQGLEYGRVMKIIGSINAAGFSKVALISENTNR
ncbi:MAG TPA: protein TolR [Alphaproteobacteria bacterium]|nr:protein TolR [Alphaproteobacteria bacterium]USO06251.1 MAG: protein TolR [Rhodospirillales bacterium]HOO81455.1 protein TolR [Alphaproteobacteria bacterium]